MALPNAKTAPMEATNDGQTDELATQRSFCAKHGKKLFVLALIIGLITAVVVDFISKGCMSVEEPRQTIRRIECARNETADLFLLSQNTTISECNLPDQDVWEFDPMLGRCTADAGCISVGVETFLSWIEENPGEGAVVTAFVYAAATVAFIPGSVLTIGSGAAFATALGLGQGVAVAATSVVIGASIGAMIAFLGGRYLLRDLVSGWASKYRVLGAIDAALAEEGLKIVLLLRFSPAIPFTAFNYVMGSTGCSFRDYAIGTVFGIMPGTVGFVFVGSAVASSVSGGDGTTCGQSDSERLINTVLLVVGIVATILAVVLITRVSRAKLKGYLTDKDQLDNGNTNATTAVDNNNDSEV